MEAEGERSSFCRPVSLCAALRVLPTFSLFQAHVSCVTEHQKYALGATKPGGQMATGVSA